MEPYKLEALIKEDLKYNGKSSLSDIKKRLEGISGDDIQKAVYRMGNEGSIVSLGAKRNRTYEMVKKSKLKINSNNYLLTIH